MKKGRPRQERPPKTMPVVDQMNASGIDAFFRAT